MAFGGNGSLNLQDCLEKMRLKFNFTLDHVEVKERFRKHVRFKCVLFR
jgi:hypothetical protein